MPIPTANFFPNHKPKTNKELMVNAKPPANAAPTTPISGRPNLPSTSPIKRKILITLVINPIYKGVLASPAALCAVAKTIEIAKTGVNETNIVVYVTASS